MTREEMKAAFMEGCPVMHNGSTYQCVSAIIYRKNPAGNGLIVQGELLDKNGNSVTIAAPDRIERRTDRAEPEI